MPFDCKRQVYTDVLNSSPVEDTVALTLVSVSLWKRWTHRRGTPAAAQGHREGRVGEGQGGSLRRHREGQDAGLRGDCPAETPAVRLTLAQGDCMRHSTMPLDALDHSEVLLE